MPILTYWEDDTKRILREDFIGQWTVDDILHMVAQSRQMVSSVDYPVDTIVDVSRSLTNPAKIFMLPNSKIREIRALTPPNQRLVLVMGMNVVWASIVKLLIRIASFADNTVHPVTSLEEAYAVIHQLDASIPEKPHTAADMRPL